jgi:ArsR family metal-binding transcriptional regulator
MLIKSYTIEVNLSTHSVNELEYEAVAVLDVDIRQIFPYLNATLPRAMYSPQKPALSWRYKGHKVGFWPDRIAVDHIHSKEEVEDVVSSLVQLVNETWEKRRQIEPAFEPRQFLQPLEIHASLPKTNCKACGESTCFNFALKLAAGQTVLEKCTPLFEEIIFMENRTRLSTLLSTKSSLL